MSEALKFTEYKSEIRDGMRIDWDVPITMSDGVVLRADVFRPIEDGQYPVLLGCNPYGKNMAFYQSVYAPNWETMKKEYPEIFAGTSNVYQTWELPNPERWTAQYGYVCVRVDSRGTGRSPGYLDIYSAQEAQDYFECIEWAGTQGWSNGKVGLLGISYLATNQWLVADKQPPHLAAICPFEGCSDFYREMLYHGGIKSMFVQRWFPRQVVYNQHGIGKNGLTSPMNGELVTGPETLTDEELAANRRDAPKYLDEHPMFNDPYYEDRKCVYENVKVPLLSCGNWGGNNLHLRGNVEGYVNAGSEQKWLELHGLEHFAEFYTDYGEKLQRDFFDHFLAGKDTWKDRPNVMLKVRKVDGTFELRGENEWPIARTQWTKLYLDTKNGNFSETPVQCADKEFRADGKGVTFMTEPLKKEVEMIGPMSAKLFISSTTTDADIFVTGRIIDPDGKDVTFIGASDPHTMPATGWLRASHRKLDLAKTTFYRPWHTHDEYQPLTPGKIYELDVEIWPTCMVLPAGYRFAITISGCDFELEGDGPWPTAYGLTYRSAGPYSHIDKVNRPDEIFKDGVTTLFCDAQHPSYIWVPIIPPKDEENPLL